MSKRKVYIADDEVNIRNLMQMFLTNANYDVSVFENGDDLLRTFLQKPADLVILDIMMPGTDGLSVCSQIRQISSTFIIIVSARDSEPDKIAGLTLGSDDYLTKPFSPVELVVRVNALFRRLEMNQASENAFTELLTLSNFTLDTKNRLVFVNGLKLELTPTEYELMLYLLQHIGKAVSREELLKNVWKFDTDIDTRATDDVMKRLRRKLEHAEAKMKIETVWGFGFRLSGDDDHEND